jgi:hypothetical protein
MPDAAATTRRDALPHVLDMQKHVPPNFGTKKMPDVDLAIRHPAFSRCVQQILNCALLVVSLSLDFFRCRGLNGMSYG